MKGNTARFLLFASFLGLTILYLTFVGCGDTTHLTSASFGSASFIIRWPERSRLIPRASKSIKVEIKQGNTLITSQVVNRPPQGNRAQVDFRELPVGDLTAIATAYPEEGGGGVPQARASAPLKIEAGKNTTITLTMASTIVRIEINPANFSLEVNQNLQLYATPRDSEGNVVLTAPENLLWSSTNTAVATVDTEGRVSAVAPGNAQIIVFEKEADKSATAAVVVTPIDGLANSAWPKFRGDAFNRGVGIGNEAIGTPKWESPTGSTINSSPAIGPDGTIYIGSNDGRIYALNSSDGSRKWTFSPGGAVASSPAVAADGTVYVGVSNGRLYALDGATGAPKWYFQAQEAITASPAIGPDGTVYIGSSDYRLYALTKTGTEKWRFTTGNFIVSCPAIGADGTLYVTSSDGKLYALNPANGAKKWEFATPEPITASPAIGADGTIYIGSFDKKVYALDSTGRRKWVYTTGGAIQASPVVGPDGTVYVGSIDGKLYALDGASGQLKWSYQTGKAIAAAPALSVYGTLYVISKDGVMHALDAATGTRKWQFVVGAPVYSSPAIDRDGTLYFGADDKKVHAVR